jgi:hypothetical protein
MIDLLKLLGGFRVGLFGSRAAREAGWHSSGAGSPAVVPADLRCLPTFAI